MHLRRLVNKLDSDIMNSEPVIMLVNDWFKFEAMSYFHRRFAF